MRTIAGLLTAAAFAVTIANPTSSFAQGASAPANPTVPPALGPGASGQAPVGHRQPTAAQAPKAEKNGYSESAEDKALDRKIKGICRGC